jgi:carbon-monoxide dehydrogenase large subunit
MQGIGQALMELAVYDGDGQLMTGSFMDYAMPHAHDAPYFEVENHPVSAKTNPLGTMGCGGLASLMNAVADALSDYGIRHVDMSASPARVWQAIQDARHQLPAR